MEKHSQYKASVDGKFTFEGISASAHDIVRSPDGHFHILKNGQSYRAEVLGFGPDKGVRVRVNGLEFDVQLFDEYDQLVERLGLSKIAVQKFNEVKAPMPGLVLSIAVSPGQAVRQGDKLLILEAMKMENVIKAAGDGTIKAVVVQQGQAVDKGQLLIELD